MSHVLCFAASVRVDKGASPYCKDPYLNLPEPTFLSVLIRNPNMEFLGTRQKSRFWWVKVFNDTLKLETTKTLNSGLFKRYPTL